jgi:hypothetical protein
MKLGILILDEFPRTVASMTTYTYTHLARLSGHTLTSTSERTLGARIGPASRPPPPLERLREPGLQEFSQLGRSLELRDGI